MIDLFPLQIFPEGGLAGSVVTTVWVGAAVVVFFNQRLGWVLSGLVVPGYLVPLLITKPAAAAVIIVESMLTYGLVWLYSEYLSQRLGWSNFFGRDRFFALVLCSILVRILGDGYLLPVLGEWAIANLDIQLDYRNNLHSFGLIIIALMANNFWKTGLRSGLIPLLTTVGVTYLIVRYLLAPLTNFNISNLSYLYEDIAVSILASPKAYIILIATAFLASRMNLLYGWDFAGILVPSLLALQWYQPEKILTSFVEATVILLLAHVLLSLPYFRGKTIEGGRKLMLFFNISYGYKFIVAYAVLWFWPEQKITDYYGFGYMLPTLLALKMHDKGIYARLTRATLQTSLASALIATLIGFALNFLPLVGKSDVAVNAPAPAVVTRKETLLEIIRQARVEAYRTRLQISVPSPNAVELDHMRQGFEILAEYRLTPSAVLLENASRLLDASGFVVERIEGHYLLVRDRDPNRYWGTYAVDLEARSELAIEVPAPLDEIGSAESGAWLFTLMRAQALAVAGSVRKANPDGSADVLVAANTAYQVFHQVFGAREVLQVRGYNSDSTRLTLGLRTPASGAQADEPASTLWVKRKLPNGLDLARLKALMGPVELRWGELELPNLQRSTLHQGFAELQLQRDDMRRLLGRALSNVPDVAQIDSGQSLEVYLQDGLIGDTTRIAAAGSNLYRVPKLEQLLFFDDEVITPLLRAMDAHYRNGAWTAEGDDALRVIQASAGVFGYELQRFHQRSGAKDFVILTEPARPAPSGEARNYWGTYVFRLGAASAVGLQVPRPILERNSFEFALSLFESMTARALLIGGANPTANRDGSADITRFGNKENLFNVVSQALLRQAGNTPMMMVQSRAAVERQDLALPSADVLMATAAGDLTLASLSPLARQLAQAVDRYGLSLAMVGAELQSAGYEAGSMFQASYLNATLNKELVVLWTSPLARAAFVRQTEATVQQGQAQALGLPSVQTNLAAYVMRHATQTGRLPPTLRDALTNYVERQDVVLLQAALRAHPALRFERVIDQQARQSFLAVLDRSGALLGVANLSARQPAKTVRLTTEDGRRAIDEFVDSRAGWLLTGSPP